MCYDDNATPPVPPVAAGPAHGEELVLTAADGNRFAAYIARPGDSADIIIPLLPATSLDDAIGLVRQAYFLALAD